MIKKKICFVTGSRSEYGLLSPLMKKIKKDKKIIFQLIVTGSHLDKKFGNTVKEIESDGFKINKRIKIPLITNSALNTSEFLGLSIVKFAKIYKLLKPDTVVLLGDRFEILSASVPALLFKIPIIHIHGGELTYSSFDDSIRHSITKIAWWHFVSTKKYKKRVIQLGENPGRVFNVGAPGLDSIKTKKLIRKTELEKKIGFKFGKRNLLVTYHPETLKTDRDNIKNFKSLLSSLFKLKNTKIIFTYPNADPGNQLIKKEMINFCERNISNFIVFSSMGQTNYYSCLNYVDLVIGNSSSGIIEAPHFKIPTINIGERQKGRLMAKSIINCNPNEKEISNSIKKAFSKKFRKKLNKVNNPYLGKNTYEKMYKLIKKFKIPKNLTKNFYDL